MLMISRKLVFSHDDQEAGVKLCIRRQLILSNQACNGTGRPSHYHTFTFWMSCTVIHPNGGCCCRIFGVSTCCNARYTIGRSEPQTKQMKCTP
jgi:hypothetical protein